MAVISFAYTTPAMLAGAKTVTRRGWKDRHAAIFDDPNRRPVDAYDKSPRNGGRKVAEILVRELGFEPIARMPDSDYEAEGFAWLHAHGVKPPASSPFRDFSWPTFEEWRACGSSYWVVRFELLTVRCLDADELDPTGAFLDAQLTGGY